VGLTIPSPGRAILRTFYKFERILLPSNPSLLPFIHSNQDRTTGQGGDGNEPERHGSRLRLSYHGQRDSSIILFSFASQQEMLAHPSSFRPSIHPSIHPSVRPSVQTTVFNPNLQEASSWRSKEKLFSFQADIQVSTSAVF
jgi:hypothetical protein